MKPLCFVLMPFGKKSDVTGRVIDFDFIYSELIRPAIEAAGLEPLRADEEQGGGIIHKPMFERLVLCNYAIADLTTANANVFYELGVRHAVKPKSTLLLFAKNAGPLPFDVNLLRALPYEVGKSGKPLEIHKIQKAIQDRLESAFESEDDSPLYQLLEDYPDIQHEKTDVFRRQVQYSKEQKERLAIAREGGKEALHEIQLEYGDLTKTEVAVLIDLLLSYRSIKAWSEMVILVEALPSFLRETVFVQEQYAFALNRTNKSAKAEEVLKQLIAKHGPSSETYGLLGRVYKDRWSKAQEEGRSLEAAGLLQQALEAYYKGFQADWRDAYPGINAITLMELQESPDPRKEQLIPMVTFAVQQRIEKGEPDYWDYATLLEVAILQEDQQLALGSASKALAVVRECWEPETTCNNLELIRNARKTRGKVVSWADEIQETLVKKSSSLNKK